MASKHFNIELLDTQKLVSINFLKEVKNPIFFSKNNMPTADGLLSNEIFGIAKTDRAGVFAYIDLGGDFLHPFVYKIWSRMDSRIKDLVHGTKHFIIDDNGELIEDPKGKTGLDFLKKNIDKIKIRTTESKKRDAKIQVIEENKKLIFTKQLQVIPAYYRDVNTEMGRIEVGEINKLYDAVLIAVRSLKETQDYGLAISDSTKGRIQEILVNIYDWFCQEPRLSKKYGNIRRAKLSKTSDYASRLVISAPELGSNSYDEMMVNLDRSALPLASACANFKPFIIFHMKRFFENEFATGKYAYMDEKGQVKYVFVKDPQMEFSEIRLQKELNRFMRGYSNRFTPIEIPNEENKKIYMKFKGTRTPVPEGLDEPTITPIYNRRLTWCDVIYMAAVEASKDKCILITRYPLEDYFGQFPTEVVISSTKKTEPVYADGNFYPWYPSIREEDIGKNTSNSFIDTLMICNLYLKAIGGDYDGDQTTVKAAYTVESNEELKDYMNSKYHYISIGGINVRVSTNQSVQAIYNLTRVLPGTKLGKPEF